MKLTTEPIKPDHRFWANIHALAKEAFPIEEYLAPELLVNMAESDQVDFLALTEQDLFVGFMVVQTYQDLAYLFFLAIDPISRSKGYGSRAIETLKEIYPDKKQVVDFEMLDETASNYSQRVKRKEFYLRNGYKETGLFVSYLGVDYEVMCMEEDFYVDAFQGLMKTIQKNIKQSSKQNKTQMEEFQPRYFYKEI